MAEILAPTSDNIGSLGAADRKWGSIHANTIAGDVLKVDSLQKQDGSSFADELVAMLGDTPVENAINDEDGNNIKDTYATITIINNLKNGELNDTIAWHNTFPRGKYLGSTITDAQNEAIRSRTYKDLFVGDYWTINGVNYRIAEVDTYYCVGDTSFNKGNIVVVPDFRLYTAQMNETNTTAGGYANSKMRTTNLAQAVTIAKAAFGNHVASHRVLMTNATDDNGPSGWAWMDSTGVELMNETQVYGTRTWSSALKAYDNGTQHHQLALFKVDPQRINIRQDYWLQDISSRWVAGRFALVNNYGIAGHYYASGSFGVRPAITLSYI